MKALPLESGGHTQRFSSHCAILVCSPFTAFKYNLPHPLDMSALPCQAAQVLRVGDMCRIYCSIPRALTGLLVNENDLACVWLPGITSRLHTPPKVGLSLPDSVSSDIIEHMAYGRSSVQSYQTDTVTKAGPSQCASINEISMHMDLKQNQKHQV